MKIVTGATGQAHVTAADDGALHAVLFDKMYDPSTEKVSTTADTYVLPIGDVLEAETISASKIRIKSGDIMMQGRHGRIPHGTYDELTIENGTTGYNRNDLIVCHYENNDGVESMTLKVLKGTPTTGTAKDPDYTTGNILTGDAEVDYPLYRVKLSGINLAGIDGLFSLWTPDRTHTHTLEQISGTLTADKVTGNWPLDRTTGNLSLDKTSGVLPVSKGGTGQNNAADALYTFLSKYKIKYGAIPIYQGGTGSDNQYFARQNLVTPYTVEAIIKSPFKIPTAYTKIPFVDASAAINTDRFNQSLFVITNNTIKRNSTYLDATDVEIINDVWPSNKKKKVYVEFTVYIYKGFTSGEQVSIYLYKNGSALNRKWIYYVKAVNPYTMYTGSCWVMMGANDYLDVRIKCTSGNGTLGNGDGADTRLTVTTWD